MIHEQISSVYTSYLSVKQNMRNIIFLVLLISCSQPNAPTYVPNPKAVELNNEATKLMFELSLFDTTKHIRTYKHVLKILDEALLIDSKNSIIYDNKNKVLIKLGRFDEALISLKEATITIENFAEGYMGIGFLYEYMNDESSANSNYKKAIDTYKVRNLGANLEKRIHNNCEIAFAKLFLNKPELAIQQIENLKSDYPNNEQVMVYYDLISNFDKKKFLAELHAK